MSSATAAHLERQHACVRAGLSAFVNAHIAGADLSVVDEIVLAYVISILEEASADPCFDVDGFVEMMSAYIPDFATIDPATICSWIFQLEGELTALNEKTAAAACGGGVGRCAAGLRSLSLSEIVAVVPAATANGGGGGGRRQQHLSETSDGGSTDSSSTNGGSGSSGGTGGSSGAGNNSNCCADFFAEECELLQEMFPDSSSLEVKHCVGIANGDIDRATQMLLDRQDAGQSLQANPAALHAPKSHVIDENELKNRIISRYSYVDKNAETKEHRPVGPKVEPKKLVRYRDNKIVSLKGERYTDVRRDDDAELKKPKRPVCP